MIAGFDTNKQRELVDQVHYYHNLHAFVKSNGVYSSEVLEMMTAKAIDETGKYEWTKRPPGGNAPLDIEIKYQGIRIGIDCKNLREWMYPHHLELWDIIQKCVERDSLPVIVTRKIPYVAFLVFKRLGIAGFQTHNQYFSPVLENQLKDIRDKDKLGFKDVIAIDTPTAKMIQWFNKTLPANIGRFKERFDNSKQILNRYATDRGLASNKVREKERINIHRELISELFPSQIGEDPGLEEVPF